MYIDEDQDFARNTISVIVGKCVSPKIWDQVVVYEGLVIVSRLVFDFFFFKYFYLIYCYSCFLFVFIYSLSSLQNGVPSS